MTLCRDIFVTGMQGGLDGHRRMVGHCGGSVLSQTAPEEAVGSWHLGVTGHNCVKQIYADNRYIATCMWKHDYKKCIHGSSHMETWPHEC